MAFSFREGNIIFWKHWNKITHEVDNPDVQREDVVVVNWIEELKVETCVTEGSVCES
jgi:hypothetical protein